jgi:hypothetical protein
MSFETITGRTIPFVPGYRAAHAKLRAAKPDLILTEEAYDPAKKSPIGYGAFVKDALLYSMMVDTFAKRNISLRAERMLEVGGSEGAVARLAKTDGAARWAQVVELFDMRPLLPDNIYLSHLRRHRIYSALRKLGHRKRGDRTELFNARDYWPNTSDKFFNINRAGDGKIDEYTIRDFYDLTGSYDLISSQCSMDYFVPPDFFKKSAELIPPGGYVYVHVAYWWYVVNMTYTIGHFPYLAQRMPRDEVVRYLDQEHAADRDSILTLYDYYHAGAMKPVLDDYVEYADAAGLELIYSRRHMPQGKNKRTPLTPEMLNSDSEHQLRHILNEVQEHAPQVRLADLKTSHVTMAFQRRAARTGHLKEIISRVRAKG